MSAETFEYKDARSTYDVDHSPEFIKLFLDRNLVYTSAYFERKEWSLEEAQLAKIDMALRKCDLEPGQTLLEVGCGCGALAKRAAEKFKVNVIALNPSIEQAEVARQMASQLPPGSGAVEVHSHGWEEWNKPVDRIVSVGALEHINPKNYEPFFERCQSLLPTGGTMLLHCIVNYDLTTMQSRGIKFTHDDLLFTKFLDRVIFPGCGLKEPEFIARKAADAGLECEQMHLFGPYYARTLEIWAANLEAKREEAIAMRDEATYDRYMKYFNGCADFFRRGIVNVCQFQLRRV